MADLTFPLLPVLGFIALLLTTAPLGFVSPRDHTGIVIFIFWQSMKCIRFIVNRILWRGTTADIAPLWCDIVSKFDLAKSVGIPASLLCIIRGIYRVVRMDNHFDTSAARRRMVLQSLIIAVAFPLVVTCSWPLIAGGRYDIVEDAGCMAVIHVHWVSLMTLFIWPLTLSLVTSLYCALTLLHCSRMTRGRVFTNQSELNRHLFSRTLACARVAMIAPLASTVHNISFFFTSGLRPFPGLVIAAKARKVVIRKPTTLAPKWMNIYGSYIIVVETILPSFVFFAIFGTGNVAARYYHRVFSSIGSRLGLTRHTSTRRPQAERGGVNSMVFAARPGRVVDSDATDGLEIELEEGVGSAEPAEGESDSTPNVA